MPATLPFFPGLPAFRYAIELDGSNYTVRFRWNTARAGWYIDLTAADGTPLLRGRRLVPYASATRGVIPGWTGGILTALGSDDRAGLTPVYLSVADLALLPKSPDPEDSTSTAGGHADATLAFPIVGNRNRGVTL